MKLELSNRVLKVVLKVITTQPENSKRKEHRENEQLKQTSQFNFSIC